MCAKYHKRCSKSLVESQDTFIGTDSAQSIPDTRVVYYFCLPTNSKIKRPQPAIQQCDEINI